MSHKCLEAMGGTPPEFPFYLTDVKVNRSHPAASQSVAPQQTGYTQHQPVAQQAYGHQEVYNPSASANTYAKQQYTQQATTTQPYAEQHVVTQPAQIAPQAQVVRIIFLLCSALPRLILVVLMPPFVFIISAACSRHSTCGMGRLAGPFKWKYILCPSDYRRGDLGDASGCSITAACTCSAVCRPAATDTATSFRGRGHSFNTITSGIQVR